MAKLLDLIGQGPTLLDERAKSIPWDVGATAAFLASPLGSAITGATIYVDLGYHAMGMAVDRESPLSK